MDLNKKNVIKKRIAKTMENLSRNNMQPFFVETISEIPAKVAELLNDGDTVGVGGAQSLFESGVIDLLRGGKYNFLDRYADGLSMDGLHEIFIKSFSANAYICSSNAITESGELYNVDGNSNRVAAIVYGPKNVIIVAGYNKIVKDLDEAVCRVKSVAAPVNAARLGSETYCLHSGQCMVNYGGAAKMCEGCRTEARICCNYVVSAFQRHKNRIKVIIVGEELGY